VDLDSVPARPETPDRSAPPPPGCRRGWGVTRQAASPRPAKLPASPRAIRAGGIELVIAISSLPPWEEP